jgi:hypothetical protein
VWACDQFAAILPSQNGGRELIGWGLLFLAGWLLWRQRSHSGPGPVPWSYWSLLAATLVVGRWTMIRLPYELYPDETQLLAGAFTLRHDPLFWRSVDGGTAGPLDYFALLPAAFFSGPSCYAVTRLIAALLIWGTLVAAGETIARVSGRAAGRLVVLPALAFEAFTTSPEFVHYSSEIVPGFMLALAVLASVRQTQQPSRDNLWAAALLLGAVPFAKLQAGPIAAGVGLMLAWGEIRAGRPRNLGLLVAAALLPTLIIAAVLTVTGQVEHMLIPYFLQNLRYAADGRLPFDRNLGQLAAQSITNGYHALWVAGNTVFCLTAVGIARGIPRAHRHHALAAGVFFLLSAAVVLSPGRPYHHYLNFLTLPLTLLAGVALAALITTREQAPAPRWPGIGFPLVLLLLCGLLPPLGLALSSRPDPFEYYNTVVAAPKPAHRELIALIKGASQPGEALGLWGWRSSLYVETGLRQANRLAHTEFLLVAGPWHKYYLRRYYEDLEASAPPVFVDTSGPGNFRFTTPATAHEIFPLLRDWVKDHYQLVGEWDGVRVYVRRDRAPAPPPPGG